MQVDIYLRNIEKVTLQVDIYFRNIEKVTMQVGAGDFHTESPADYFHSKSPARSPYSQLIVSCTATTATTIITTVPLFNHTHYCHGVKEGPALCVFCSTIFTISGLFDDIVPVLIQCRLPSISGISKKLQCCGQIFQKYRKSYNVG